MPDYIGNRIVPRHDGVWDKTKKYEPLIIVYEEGTGDSYISRREVPAGTTLSQTDYWAMCARFSEQVEVYKQGTSEEITAYKQELSRQADKLRSDTAEDVSQMHQHLDETKAAMSGELQAATKKLTQKTDNASNAVEQNRQAMEQAVQTLTKRLDANVTASTQPNGNYAAELVDARVDEDGTVHASAGENIRSIGKVRSLRDVLRAWGWKDKKIVNENGELISMDSWCCAHMIPVNSGKILISGKFSFMSGSEAYNNIVCFDRNRKYLGGCFRAENGKLYPDYEVALLPGTAYISVITTTVNKGNAKLYLPEDMRALNLLNNMASAWQWMNGRMEVALKAETVSVIFTKGSYLCRIANGSEYRQDKVEAQELSFDFKTTGWWCIYYDTEAVKEEKTDENEVVITEAAPGILVKSCGTEFHRLFTPEHFVLAVFYDSYPVYAAPSTGGTVIGGVDYGNPAALAKTASDFDKYLGQEIFLAYGGIALDTEAGTIQITKKILGVCNTASYFWLEADEEPVPLLESQELELGHMVILGYDHQMKKINLYDTKTFQALGSYGYYIAAWYQKQLWFPHMSPGLSFTLNGVTYKAGEMFETEISDTFIEKKYRDRIDSLTRVLSRQDTHSIYLAYGKIEINDASGTIRVAKKILGVPENKDYQWIQPTEEAVQMATNTPSETYGTPMRILGYDAVTDTVNLYGTGKFLDLGTAGYYIASWYQGKLYHAQMSPMMEFTINGTEYLAGQLFETEGKDTFVEKKYKDYVASYVAGKLDPDDTLGDIVTPSHWDCMEGRQFSLFFDCLTRNEGRENLYRISNSKSLTRNEFCMNYTPTAADTDFNVTVSRLDKDTLVTAESKPVKVCVHHPLTTKLTKNVCICGDSLVDNGSVATEVFRLLAEDGDCTIHQIGTRGPAGGKHEGRGSWTFARYLQGDDYAGKSNAFWDGINGRLDFKKYCERNGFTDGINYFLIALGTNDVTQGSALYRTEAEVQKFIDQAKKFIDALLSVETGFPNCKVGIGLCGPGADYSFLVSSSMAVFRKSINTLNLALIKNFDAGKYHKNVTCFAHGLRTDRRLAFPYADKPVADRFTETSRTFTNSIHPSARGYQAWADGYYCQIRAFLTEDAK